jgi:hypothetical protein
MGRSSFRVCVLDSPSVSCLLSRKKSSPASLSSSPSLRPQQNPLDSHHHSPGLPRAPLPHLSYALRLSIQPFNLLLILPLRSTLPLTNGKNGLPLPAKSTISVRTRSNAARTPPPHRPQSPVAEIILRASTRRSRRL